MATTRTRSARRCAPPPPGGRKGEAGFTLIEALIAIVILAFGLIGVSNLLLVAATSNSAANASSVAATIATQHMERLRAATFESLVPGGDLESDVGGTGDCSVVLGTYNCTTTSVLPGVGELPIHVRWQIVTTTAPNMFFIAVRAESPAPFMGRRTRAQFTTFRMMS